jgi:hypothetical protein
MRHYTSIFVVMPAIALENPLDKTKLHRLVLI